MLLFRKCVCYDGNPPGQTPPVRGQLPHPQPRPSRPPGGGPRHASRSGIRGDESYMNLNIFLTTKSKLNFRKLFAVL